jgi:hypothetical protein
MKKLSEEKLVKLLSDFFGSEYIHTTKEEQKQMLD